MDIRIVVIVQANPYIPETGPYNRAMPIGIGRPAKANRTNFGEQLASAREQAGLTQVQLAAKLGSTQRVIAYWERSSVALRPEQLAALADALDVSTDFLLSRHAPRQRGTGPAGKARQAFEKVSKLPRRQQDQIIKVIDALVAQATPHS